MKNLKFSIVIANFNGEKLLSDCLSSVFKTYYPNFEVVIIEDGSYDSSLEILQRFQENNKFKLIHNDQNLGLVASRNKAIKIASGEVIVFLDNDTKVNKDWLKGLSQVFSVDSSIGAAQCKIFDFKKMKEIQEIGMKLIPFTGFGTPLGRGEKDSGQFEKQEEIIALGAALAVRKKVAEKIGGFDQKLFHYTDDLDFSWRVWLLGYRVVLAPNAKVYHYTKVHNPTYKLYFHLCKNSIRMIIKNYELVNTIKFLPFSLVLNIIGGIYVIFSRGSLNGILGVLLGMAWNLFNLSDTFRERSKIQKLRRVTDKDIFDKIMISTNILDIFKIYFHTGRNKKNNSFFNGECRENMVY